MADPSGPLAVGGVDAAGKRGAAGPGPLALERAVRDALAHVYDPVYLQTHPLHRLLPDGPPREPSAAGRSGAGAGRALRRRLLEALAALRPEFEGR